jgi:putative intracellular protease/amidase/YHS domain-containing protein
MKKQHAVFRILLIFLIFGRSANGQEIPQKPSIKSIVILLYEGFTPLDAVGPYQVLSGIMGAEVKTVAKQKGIVKSDGALSLKADYGLSEIKQADILIVPGGFGGTYKAAHDTVITNWIKRIDKTTRYTTSICTGAWILGAAGLLKHKDATTHWYGKEILEGHGAHYKAERYVKQGKIYTAAGVSAGIDMALALLAEISGDEYAKAMQLLIEYDPKPPFDAGTPAKSDSATLKMLTQMYDAGIENIRREADEFKETTQGKNGASKKAITNYSKILQEDGIDPVCKMKVKKGTTLTTDYRGKRYGFCSEMCKREFERDGSRFAYP